MWLKYQGDATSLQCDGREAANVLAATLCVVEAWIVIHCSHTWNGLYRLRTLNILLLTTMSWMYLGLLGTPCSLWSVRLLLNCLQEPSATNVHMRRADHNTSAGPSEIGCDSHHTLDKSATTSCCDQSATISLGPKQGEARKLGKAKRPGALLK